MTQVGEGQEASGATPPVMTFGSPTAGEVLADRYQLAEHVNNDSAGRQVWRGVDVILRRPVAVVLRYPGGDSAQEMLKAAVTASRVVHPNLVGVYDAIDEENRAYVVREWVDGQALRDLVAGAGPLDAERTTSIAHAVAGAVAAVHATGMVHGNIHPGTVLIANDGRVVLADARADGADTPETDIRAIGGILYFALTGHWPHAEAGRSLLPDAVRDGIGAVMAPRQARAGVPAYLDDLTMDLIDPTLSVPSADVLAAELGRLDTAQDQYFDEIGPLRFATVEDPAEPRPPAGRKIAVGVAALLVIAVVGLFFGIRALTSPDSSASGEPSAPGASAGAGTADATSAAKPQKIALSADHVRLVDPKGDGREQEGIADSVDGDPNTAWESDTYRRRRDFGGLKNGMGLLVDLGEARTVSSVKVMLSDSGVSAELRAGDSDGGDAEVLQTFQRVGEPYADSSVTTMAFVGFEPGTTYRYLLFWITELPPSLKIGVQEIIIEGS